MKVPVSASLDKLGRRSFLRQSSVVAAAATASRFFSLPALGHVLETESPIATTASGKVRGSLDNGVNVFKGIRYGADTTARRFMPPAPPEPWADVREAIAYGPSAPQTSRASDQGSGGSGGMKRRPAVSAP